MNDQTTDQMATTEVTYEKGTWQHDLDQSSSLLDRSTKARKRASALLWDGAKAGIEEWFPNSSDDVNAEGLYSEVLSILGKPRKGDASKIKTVAVAVRVHGLDLSSFPNLSKAYAEATRLTKTVQQQQDEDDAAEKAVESIEVPKSTTTVEGAAAILLSRGVDGAVVAILDALNGPSGTNNEAAHRAFMRAVSTEVAARVQAAKPKPAPRVNVPKAGATKTQAGVTTAKATATPAKAKAKAKPVAKKATATRAEVVTSDKGEPVAEPVEAGVDADAVTTPDVPVKKAVRKPVRRPARAAS